MPAFVYPERVVNVNVSSQVVARVLGTTYQNTSNRPKLQIISLDQISQTIGDLALVSACWGSADSGGNPAAWDYYVQAAIGVDILASQATLRNVLIFAVSPGQYFRAIDNDVGTGASTILRWVEVTL